MGQTSRSRKKIYGFKFVFLSHIEKQLPSLYRFEIEFEIFTFQIVFPNSYHLPPSLLVVQVYFVVSLLVSLYLVIPKFRSSFRRTVMFFASVPKTRIYKNHPFRISAEQHPFSEIFAGILEIAKTRFQSFFRKKTSILLSRLFTRDIISLLFFFETVSVHISNYGNQVAVKTHKNIYFCIKQLSDQVSIPAEEIKRCHLLFPLVKDTSLKFLQSICQDPDRATLGDRRFGDKPTKSFLEKDCPRKQLLRIRIFPYSSSPKPLLYLPE